MADTVESERAALLRGQRNYGDMLQISTISPLRELGRQMSQRAFSQEEGARKLAEARAKEKRLNAQKLEAAKAAKQEKRDYWDYQGKHPKDTSGVLSPKEWDRRQKVLEERKIAEDAARIKATADAKTVKMDATKQKRATELNDAMTAVDNALEGFKLEFGKDTSLKSLTGALNPQGGALETWAAKSWATLASPEATERVEWFAQHADQFQAKKIHDTYGAQLAGNEQKLWESFAINPELTGEQIQHRLVAMKKFITQKQNYGKEVALAEGVPYTLVHASYHSGNEIPESALVKARQAKKDKAQYNALPPDERAIYDAIKQSGGG